MKQFVWRQVKIDFRQVETLTLKPAFSKYSDLPSAEFERCHNLIITLLEDGFSRFLPLHLKQIEDFYFDILEV